MIVVADDLETNRSLLRRLLTRDGHRVEVVEDGAAALALVHRELPDLIISDVVMPHVDGLELCRRIKGEKATRLIPVVLITGLAGHEDRLAGIDAGADDFLTKPFNEVELRARVRSLLRLRRFTNDLDSAESVILSLALTVEARDANTGGHCERMASYASAFGTHLGLPEEAVSALHRGGYLHDVGKIGIADSILLKQGRLTADEFEMMKRHTVIGENLCGTLRLLRLVRPIVRHHHERLDGSGYPDGLAGEAVPLLAQIMGIVDVFDAVTTPRPYRQPLSADGAFAQLQSEADAGWRSPRLVEEFIAMHRAGKLAASASA